MLQLTLGNRLLVVKERKETHTHTHSIMLLLLQLGKFMKILEEESSMMRLSSVKIAYHSSVSSLKGEGDMTHGIFPQERREAVLS